MERHLATVLSRPGRSGIFLDFDGTLSDIAATPEEARAVHGVAELLPRLAARFGVVAVVSGRQAVDVASRLEVDPESSVRVYGLYGLERLGGAGPAHPEMVARVDRVMPEVARAAAYVPGAVVEHKGLQLAVHYRSAPDHDAARRVLLARLARVADELGMRLLEGKRVVELAPARGPTKGDVVRSIAAGEPLEAVLYAGDDVADLDAFAALDDLRAAGVATTKVAVRSSETPERVLLAADVVVDAPAGLFAVLSRLAA